MPRNEGKFEFVIKILFVCHGIQLTHPWKVLVFPNINGIEVINLQRFYRESESGENLVHGKDNHMIELSG